MSRETIFSLRWTLFWCYIAFVIGFTTGITSKILGYIIIVFLPTSYILFIILKEKSEVKR